VVGRFRFCHIGKQRLSSFTVVRQYRAEVEKVALELAGVGHNRRQELAASDTCRAIRELDLFDKLPGCLVFDPGDLAEYRS